MLNIRHLRGFTLIELMITVAIVGILLSYGVSSYREWSQRSQIRVAAETIRSGMAYARSQALTTNTRTQFSLVSSLTSSCVVSGSGKDWVVSELDPTGECGDDPSDTVAPRIKQKKAGTEGSRDVTVDAKDAGGNASGSVSFSGLGRMLGANSIVSIDLRNPSGGTCLHEDAANGKVRCLRILLTTGGESRLCDPKVTDASDPRKC